ncbi:MAG TPA: glycosyltransferase family 4 protein [Aquabacterium sp.]|uniref:glycosyltransferase family 4 protein n=1 Tax=Aquabacterium sp. TaxID=1872578 RepID=UPI002E2F7912|nr:glycosyltransferase family 4 protein [Aquabacterium sp.]HEX5355220.1 glycosyltransferase family 4 protein [Aquabacterium sp.]
MKKLRCVVVTNVPTPYRLPIWDILADSGDVDLHVVYCAGAHIDPSKDGRSSKYGVHFLEGEYTAYENRFAHADWSVTRLLDQLKPDVVVTSGFIPTFLYAFAWSVWRGVPHVVMTDGTLESEQGLSWVHRLVRRVVFARTRAFIGACLAGRDLFASYGVRKDSIFVSPLCIDNDHFGRHGAMPRPYDFLYCGRYIERKNPLFALRVAKGVAERLGRKVTFRCVGKGAMEPELRQLAQELAPWVDVSFTGYKSQEELPLEYASSKIFMFPTTMEPWGVVVNEACAAGTPTVSTPHTGVAGELIIDGVSGFICELDEGSWVARCATLLSDGEVWTRCSDGAKAQVKNYTFAHAATGFLNAVRFAAAGGKGSPR